MARRRDLIRAGVDRRWLDRRVTAVELVEILPGVLADPSAAGDRDALLRAGLVHAGPTGRLSHRSAAELLLPGLTRFDSHPVEVVVARGVRRRSFPAVVVRQSGSGWREIRAGLPVTDIITTLRDLAAQMSLNDFRCLVTEAVRVGALTPDDLMNQPGMAKKVAARVRLVAAESIAGAISGGEAGYWRLVHDSSLPDPELNVRVILDDRVFFIDALWDELRLGVEIDGREVHAQQAAFDEDRIRQNLIQTHGILLLRFTVAQVFAEPDRVLAMTDAALRARAAELGIPARW